MLLLTASNHKLQIRTSAAVNTDWYVTYADRTTGGPIGLGRGTINTIKTEDVVPSPAQDVLRVVKSLFVRNRHASTQQEITVVHTDGTTPIELRTVVLYPGDTLAYDERNGFTLYPRMAYQNGATQPAVNQLTLVTLPTAVQSNATANVLTGIASLGLEVSQGGIYRFVYTLIYSCNATTTGSRFTLSGPAAAWLSYDSEYSLTTTTTTKNANLMAYDVPAATNATSGMLAGNVAYIRGIIQPSANGTLTPRFASEIAGAGNITVQPGSMLEWIRMV